MVEHFPALDLFQRRQSEAEIVAVKKSGQAKSHEGMAVAREKLNQTVGQVFHKLKEKKKRWNTVKNCFQIT